ncbi:MAG TPA: DUF2333 family protein [Rhizobiaceae bacterium]|nr:DUF2333 family protein [Rhizobiaceae bacterium]
MLDPIVNFFTRVFQWIGRGIGFVVGILLWPFMWFGRWYTHRGWTLKAVVGLFLVGLFALYVIFIWNTQRWTNFNPAYPESYTFAPPAGSKEQITDEGQEGEVKTCTTSGIVTVTGDLIDFNVNQNSWISSMLLYKLGLFGLDWDRTPFMDNKASFQRGVNQAIRRTAVELVDTLGRVRGTSQIDANLQKARGDVQYSEDAWYFGLMPFGFQTPTPTYYRSARISLRAFNDSMLRCEVVFNARADNLALFVDRIASDLGSTADILSRQAQAAAWIDARADDRFWFAYGQLYGYYGILKATRADFDAVIQTRGLGPLWDRLDQQFKSALSIQPSIVFNSSEDGMFATHLTTMGFYVLSVRTNLVEIRQVLDR